MRCLLVISHSGGHPSSLIATYSANSVYFPVVLRNLNYLKLCNIFLKFDAHNVMHNLWTIWNLEEYQLLLTVTILYSVFYN